MLVFIVYGVRVPRAVSSLVLHPHVGEKLLGLRVIALPRQYLSETKHLAFA
jgi:hypothetical protein